MDTKSKVRVVIVGGGFGGLLAARTIAGNPVQVTLIDRQNFHTFQPLLYQVATAGVEPQSIVYPFRKIFDDHTNFYFRMAEVLSVDTSSQVVETSIGYVNYDFLVVATGAATNFYGNTEIQQKAIALKSIDDALSLRN